MLDLFYYNGKVEKAKIKDIAKYKKYPLWIDATNLTQKENQLLQKEFNLHPLTAEDMMSIRTRTKVEEFPDYLICVFYGIHKTRKIDLIELDFLIGKSFIITSHNQALESFTKVKKDTDMLAKLFQKGPDYIFHKLLDLEVDNYSPVLEQLDDNLENMERQAAKKPDPKILTKILEVKHELTEIRKSAYQLRDKTGFLAKNRYAFLSAKTLPYFRDVYDHAIRVHDKIDSYRESAANAFDVYMSTVSNNMNEVMKVLSIIATIALPLTVVSGIYGTNFDNLPGAHEPFGFWIMVIVMAAMIVVMLLYFRRREWI